jgi:hypothetical protein
MKKLFAILALAAAMLACTPEQVETAFKLAGGKVLVEVEIVDFIHGGTYSGPVDIHFTRGGLDVTSEFQTIVGAGPHAYMWQAAESQAVASGDYGVIVKGSELAKDYTSAFVFPEVLAGGEAKVKVVVPVGEPLNEWTVDYVYDRAETKTWTDTLLLANSEYPTHAYTHDGIDTWYYNNSEYLLDADVTYWDESYAVTYDKEKVEILGFETVVDQVEDAFLAMFPWDGEENVFSFKVSAWAMWNVTQRYSHVSVPVTVFVYKDADKDGELDSNEEFFVLGGFTLEYIMSYVVEPHELPYPGAAGHYHYGHGHDAHGTMPNAGGGMSINE